jgi:hypothetical protein
VIDGEPPEDGIAAKEAVREESGGEERAVGEGEQIPKARPEKGPPGGDSHREGETAENIRLPPLFPHHATL